MCITDVDTDTDIDIDIDTDIDTDTNTDTDIDTDTDTDICDGDESFHTHELGQVTHCTFCSTEGCVCVCVCVFRWVTSHISMGDVTHMNE